MPVYLLSRESSLPKPGKHHWDEISDARSVKFFSKNYHGIMDRIYKNIIPEGVRILEIGCYHGDLLNILKPAYGVGIDFSERIIEHAKTKYRSLDFLVADAHDLNNVKGPFDYIILSDLVNDIFDIQEVFKQITKICSPQTRVVVNIFNHMWELPINAARKAGLARPNMPQNLVDR